MHLTDKNPLGNLTDAQMEALIARYYAGESATALIRYFDIKCRPSELCRNFPPIPLDINCRHCRSRMHRIHVPRGNSRLPPARCKNCGHAEEGGCRCHACALEFAQLVQAARQRTEVEIARYCAESGSKAVRDCAVPTDFCLTSAVALVALARATGLAGNRCEVAVNAAPVPYGPTSAFTREMLHLLWFKSMIAPDPTSDPGGFVFEGNVAIAHVPEALKWIVTVSAPSDTIHHIEAMSINGVLPAAWREQAQQLHGRVAQAECRAYFNLCANGRGLPLRPPGGVDEMIKNLLIDNSVSQAFRIIWAGAAAAADFRARKRATAQHGANYMIQACQRWADKARSGGWPNDGFKRPFQLPQSIFSAVLYDVVLKVGSCGFTSNAKDLVPLS